MKQLWTACALLLASAGTSAIASPQQTALDTQGQSSLAGTTASGTTFTLSPGWSRTSAGKIVTLTSPERNYRMAIIDVGPATDAKAAAEEAWGLWAPDKARPAKLITPRTPRNGWDERQVVDYETSPNEKRALFAVAYRQGTNWTLILADGAEATGEKRLAAIGLVQQSLRPAGYKRESFAGLTAKPMDAARIAALRSFVEQAAKELGVPGAAIAITDRSRTLYSGGIGVRTLGDPTPVDGDTSFAIASNTKGMGTLLLAKLVDEGKLKWDQPVTEVYKSFRLGSDETTSKVLVKHLVCACTGLPRKDYQVIFNSDPKAAAKDTFAQLASTEPTSGFGEVFQYNNLMASAAGYIGGNLTYPSMDLDRAFERAVNEKVWRPLGMTRTTLDFAAGTRGNWARPHAINIAGNPELILENGQKLNYAFTRYGAAGGAWSTANDLARYVRFELNEGKLDDGRQYISATNVLRRRQANVPVGEDRVYGMGMQVDSDYGVDVVHHGGSLGGYKSDIVIIPAAGIGAVLLTNSDDGQPILRPFMRRLLELLYDGKPEAAADVTASAARIKAEIAKEAQLVSQTPDAAAAEGLAASYENSDLGPLQVLRDSKGTRFAFRTMTSPVGTKKNEDGTTSFVALDPTLLFFPLVAGTKDGKRILTARDSQHEYVFFER
jgi:CubicO group peptidase (beta-lactamase class C family)